MQTKSFVPAIQKGLCWLISLLMLFSSVATAAPQSVYAPSADTGKIDTPKKQFMELLALVPKLRSQIDRSQFETDRLVESLDFDPDSIVKFVTSQISFEPYPGLLRGPAGTLRSRAGNALDQSTLLAKLLKDAGYEARVVGAKIPERAAAQLLRATAAAQMPATQFTSSEKARAVMREMAAVVEMDPGQVEQQLATITDTSENRLEKTSLHQAATEEAALLIEVLSNTDNTPADSRTVTEIKAVVSDYYWVQYKPGTGDWIDAHPAFGGQDSPAIEPAQFFTDQIPNALQHRVRIQAHATVLIGDHFKDHALFPAWERPAANLAEMAVTYAHSPLSQPAENQEPWQYLASGEVYVPTLNGQIVSDEAFDLAGNMIPMMAVQSMGAALFKTVSDKTRLAESALAGLGSESNTDTSRFGLSQVWIEITLIGPGGEERVYKRTIYNPCTEHAPLLATENCVPKKPSIEDRLTLTTPVTLAIAVGQYPQSYLLDRVLERIEDNKELFLLALDPAARTDVAAWAKVRDIETSWLGFLPLYDLMDRSLNTAHVYRPATSAVLFRQHVSATGSYSTSLDILSNRKLALRVQDETVQLDRTSLVYEGVWETGAENYFLSDDYDIAATRAFPFSRAKATAKELVYLENRDHLPEWAGKAISDSIASGYSVVALNGGSDTSDVAWYRVDPATGETLGLTHQGQGGALEYVGKLLGGLFVVAPIYVLGCHLAGASNVDCLLFGRAVATLGVGAMTFALAVFGAVFFGGMSEAH